MTRNKKYFLTALFLSIFLIILINAIFIKAPIKQTFEYDTDEGFELMKPVLLQKGFSLYKEIYNDQPPLFTLILSSWFKLFSPSVYHGRILILVFSAILIWAFYGIVKNPWGDLCAFLAVTFLILSQLYLRLSSSIMLVIPPLSLAMLSILCVILYKKSQAKYLLLLSGIFMAVSLHTKLIAAFLIPIIAFEIIQTTRPNLREKGKLNLHLPPLLLWLSGFLLVYLSILLIFFHFDFSLLLRQLIQPHFTRSNLPEDNFSVIWQMILSDYDIALLALMGIILLVRQKKWQLFFPVLWLATALAVLAIYRPIWDHYYLLVSIPICWLAAISFSQFFGARGNRDRFLRWLTAAIIILTILKIPSKYNRMSKSIAVGTAPDEHKVVELLLKYKKKIHWIFTDRPIFAFYADILVPPELVLTIEKRSFTDNLTQDYFIGKLGKYKPEMIILNELKYFGPSAISYIQDHYTLLYKLTSHYPYRDEANDFPLETELLIKLKDCFYQIGGVKPNLDQEYSCKLLSKELLDKTTYFLAGILEEPIVSTPRLMTKEDLNANPILPFTLSEDGKFGLKPYDKVSKKWQEKIHDQPVSFFAYQFFKKIFTIWQAEEGKNANSTPTILRLKLLRERILEDMKKEKIWESPYAPEPEIELYIRNDIS